MSSKTNEYRLLRTGTALCESTLAFGLVAAFLVLEGRAQEVSELPVPAEIALEEIAAPSTIDSPMPISESEAVLLSNPVVDEDGVETLIRGPLHEAFAEPITADPAPGFVVNREPPDEINEVPPDYRPDGDRAIWISGYWGWDDQREDFIWISGVYRVPPDGHRWVPGYWHSVDTGWQWVQGFWVSDVVESIEYLPAPPTSLEVGPSSPSPGLEYFYVPGTWSQSDASYQWTAGYWHPIQDDFIWIPSHVVWTPRGCVYVPGYWDRRLPLRGLCFAPVYIPRTTYSIASWHWQPRVVLNSQVVLHNLFVQPQYCHYVFGDYYGLPISHHRTIPAYVYHQRRGHCDPLISFYTAYNARQGHDLIRWYGTQFNELSRNPAKRPPHVFHHAHSSTKGPIPNKNALHTDLAAPLEMLSKIEGSPRIAPVSRNLKQELQDRDKVRKQLAIDRRLIEREPSPLQPILQPIVADRPSQKPFADRAKDNNQTKLAEGLKPIVPKPTDPSASRRDNKNELTLKLPEVPKGERRNSSVVDNASKKAELPNRPELPKRPEPLLQRDSSNNAVVNRIGQREVQREESNRPAIVSPAPNSSSIRNPTMLPSTNPRVLPIPSVVANQPNLTPPNPVRPATSTRPSSGSKPRIIDDNIGSRDFGSRDFGSNVPRPTETRIKQTAPPLVQPIVKPDLPNTFRSQPRANDPTRLPRNSVDPIRSPLIQSNPPANSPSPRLSVPSSQQNNKPILPSSGGKKSGSGIGQSINGMPGNGQSGRSNAGRSESNRGVRSGGTPGGRDQKGK